MHPKLVEELIAEEVERARADGLLRDHVRLEQRDRRVVAHARRGDAEVVFSFYGPNYNAEPFQFAVVDGATLETLPAGQRRGFGTATLDLIVEYFRSRGVGTMWTSVGQGEGSPVTFYERYGFKRTGDFHGKELLLRLEISQHGRVERVQDDDPR